MQKAEGSSCLEHIVPSSLTEALNPTYQSGKYIHSILGVYASKPFSTIADIGKKIVLTMISVIPVFCWVNCLLFDVLSSDNAFVFSWKIVVF